MNQHWKKQIFCPPGARRGKTISVDLDPKNLISSTPFNLETSVHFTNGSPKPKTEPWMHQEQLEVEVEVLDLCHKGAN